MKPLTNYLVAVFLFAISFGALAGPNVKDVENAMRAQNWTGAEQMLNQVLVNKPNSAKAHYLLAQTHEQMGQKSLAASDLERAKAADPSMKFASPGAVSRMEQRLTSQTARYAEQPVQRKQVREQPTYAPPAVVANPVAQTTSPSPVVADQNTSSGGGGVLLFILALAVMGGVGFFVYSTRQKKQAIAAAAAKAEAARRALLSRAVDLQTRTTELQKTLKYEGQEDSQLGLHVDNLVSIATSMLSRLKGSVPDGFNVLSENGQLNNLDAGIQAAEARLAAKDFDGAKEAAAAKKRQEEAEITARRSAQQRAEREREDAIRRKAQAERDAVDSARREREYRERQERERNNPRPVEHHHHHNRGSDVGDLLTGVLVGSALSGLANASNKRSDDGWGNDSTPAYEAPPPRNDPPALDFGGGDSWDNDSDDDRKRNRGSNDDDGF